MLSYLSLMVWLLAGLCMWRIWQYWSSYNPLSELLVPGSSQRWRPVYFAIRTASLGWRTGYTSCILPWRTSHRVLYDHHRHHPYCTWSWTARRRCASVQFGLRGHRQSPKGILIIAFQRWTIRGWTLRMCRLVLALRGKIGFSWGPFSSYFAGFCPWTARTLHLPYGALF